MAGLEKPTAAQTTEIVDGSSSDHHSHEDNARTKTKAERATPVYPLNDEDYVVTWKTWSVCWILAWSYGMSFWIVPCLSPLTGQIATQFGDASKAAWYLSTYTMTVAIAFMVCGANSDLFGRRWFIIGGNILMFIGFIIGATAKSNSAMIASIALIGFGGGNAQLAAFALPELLPNKWRHIGVVIADFFVIVAVVIGPVTGRFAGAHGEAWRWLFWAPMIGTFFSFLGLYFFYYPPKHPRGLPFGQAVRELDYVGALLFIAATCLILTGVNYTTILSSSSPIVIGTLVAGFGTMVLFGLYEHFMPKYGLLKQPLTPTHVFTANKGRALTAPFIAAFVVTMFYYMVNIVYPTMISLWFAPTDFKYAAVMTLPSNLGLAAGSAFLTFLGSKIKHWRWQLILSIAGMVVFGALLALGNPDRKGLMVAMVFLCQFSFGVAQYLSIVYVQVGADQRELGISGGLAGVARFAGGAVAISVYLSILANVQSKNYAPLVGAAATAAGLPESSLPDLLAAIPLGTIASVPGITDTITTAALAAFQQSYVIALRITALSSLSFGILGIIAACFCEDIGPKMDNKIEIYLENDQFADRNTFH